LSIDPILFYKAVSHLDIRGNILFNTFLGREFTFFFLSHCKIPDRLIEALNLGIILLYSRLFYIYGKLDIRPHRKPPPKKIIIILILSSAGAQFSTAHPGYRSSMLRRKPGQTDFGRDPAKNLGPC